MKRKIFSSLLCFAMTGALLAGCGGSGTNTNTDNSASTQADTATEAISNEPTSLVIPVSATVTTLNGNLETMAEGTFQLAPYQDELYFVA